MELRDHCFEKNTDKLMKILNVFAINTMSQCRFLFHLNLFYSAREAAKRYILMHYTTLQQRHDELSTYQSR